MSIKVIFIAYCVVLRNSIISQPVKENENVRDTRQSNFQECCPCPEPLNNGVHPSDYTDLSTFKTASSSVIPSDDCSCRLPGLDSQGSSSLFRPFFLRADHPSEKQQGPKQDIKPLLEPEVGLASSVLETLQKVTDEEYQDALARDAARSALKLESDFDREVGNSGRTVTIVLNPSDDLYDSDDTIPEASHVQETRCVHSPLRKTNLLGRARIANPRLSNEYLLVKRKPNGISYQIPFDMDKSASNIQERFHTNNNLGNKLKINPLFLNTLPNTIDEQLFNNSYPRDDFGYQLKTISPENCNDLDRKDQTVHSPTLKLAALKDKLRDLSEIRRTNLLKNNLNTAIIPNYLRNFNYKSDSFSDLISRENNLNSPLDTFFDKQSPFFKNILNLKDVELLPPQTMFNQKGLSRENNIFSDLKIAGSENNGQILRSSEGSTDNVINTDDVLVNDSLSNEEERSDTDSNVDEITQKIIQYKYSDGGSSTENSKLQNDCPTLDSVESSSRDNINTDLENNEPENISEEDDDMEDTISEMSSNILQKSSQEVTETIKSDADISDNNENVCSHENLMRANAVPNSLIKNTANENYSHGSLLQRNNDGLMSFRDDVLKRLENLKNTIKSKLKDTDSDLREHSKSNSEGNQNLQIPTESQWPNEKDITFKDLQEYSDDLLEQENSSKAKAVGLLDSECNTVKNDFINSNEDNEMFRNDSNDNLNLDSTETQLSDNPTSFVHSDDSVKSNPKDHQEKSYLENSRYTCDNVDTFDTNKENDISKEASPISEMSSQASNFKYNAIRPTIIDNSLKAPLEREPLNQSLEPTEIASPLLKTLQIPSLEEIRQGISNIIDAGQKDEKELRLADSDPLIDSTNHNAVVSTNMNFRPNIRPLQNRQMNYVRKQDTNAFGPKSAVAKTTSLQLNKPGSLRNNWGKLRSDPLFLGPSKTKPVAMPKLQPLSLNETPYLANLRDFFQNQNNIKQTLDIPKTNIDKIAIFSPQIITSIADDIRYQSNKEVKPDLKKVQDLNKAKQDSILLRQARPESKNLLENMNRRREDLNEKVQALHLDLNNRLASIHQRFQDQANLRSVNIPVNQERASTNNKMSPLKISLPFENMNGVRKIGKQSGFTPKNSNIKISFSTTTVRPVVKTNLFKKPVLYKPTKIPQGTKEKYKYLDLRSNLKDTSKPRFGTTLDTDHAPSELIHTKIPNPEAVNEDDVNIYNDLNRNTVQLGINKKQFSLNQKPLDLYNNPLTTQILESSQDSNLSNNESSVISNMKDALRARLQNITNASKIKTNQRTDLFQSASNTIVSPLANSKTTVDNVLKENTSYKCSMICVKDP